MVDLWRRGWCLASGLLVPLLSLASPGMLQLVGIGPAWAVLWLLPWALVDGPVSGALVGSGLALLLDSLHPDSVSALPALAALGWWWGRMGRRGPMLERYLPLALLAVIGSLVLGACLALQLQLRGTLPTTAMQVLLAQALLTGLLAPLACSFGLLLWRQRLPGVR